MKKEDKKLILGVIIGSVVTAGVLFIKGKDITISKTNGVSMSIYIGKPKNDRSVPSITQNIDFKNIGYKISDLGKVGEDILKRVPDISKDTVINNIYTRSDNDF